MVVNRQRGMTFFGWIVFLLNLVFLAWFAITAVLMHLEAMKVISVIDYLKKVERVTQKTKREIKDIVDKRMLVDYLDDAKREEYVKQMQIKTSDSKLNVSIDFEVRKDFLFGIVLAKRYKHDVEIIAH